MSRSIRILLAVIVVSFAFGASGVPMPLARRTPAT